MWFFSGGLNVFTCALFFLKSKQRNVPRLSQSQNSMEWREATRLGQGREIKEGRARGRKGNTKEEGLGRGLIEIGLKKNVMRLD